jgi:hypothetical protein
VLAIRRIVAVAKALALVGSDMLADNFANFAIAINSCRRFGIAGSLCMRDASTPGLRGACLSRRARVASCSPVSVSDVPVFVGPEPLSFAAAALVAPPDGPASALLVGQVVAGPSNFASSSSSSLPFFRGVCAFGLQPGAGKKLVILVCLGSMGTFLQPFLLAVWGVLGHFESVGPSTTDEAD